MKIDNTPIIKDLVLIGGGHSNVTVLKKFGMKPLPGVRLTMICRDVHTPYSGMLPGLVAGHYAYDDAHIDLGVLARFAGARVFKSEVIGLDLDRKHVICDNRPPVPYDVLSINCGSTPRTSDVPGARENTIPVKPIDRFLNDWEALAQRVLNRENPISIAVVGAGAGGVEMLLAIQYRLEKLGSDLERHGPGVEFHLFGEHAQILPTHNESVRREFEVVLRDRAVNVHLGSPVVEVSGRTIVTRNGDRVTADEILWVTAAGAPSWPAQAGLSVNTDGFIEVTDTLQSVSHPDVFAAGDVAAMVNHPRPKSGVFAVRQGPPLANNLRRILLHHPLRKFRPQSRFLSLISTGDRNAVASWGGWAAKGRILWLAKDWIDRRFMRKFSDLPEMSDETSALVAEASGRYKTTKTMHATSMRCGGCGAKIGAAILGRVLGKLDQPARDNILIGLEQPDDAAVILMPPGMAAVHTVDSFRAMIDDPFVFGKIAANHSLSDIYAMGGQPQTALTIATLPFGLDAKTEDTLAQMMAGAMEILREAGATLIGGHTGEGAELSLGFAINGLIDPTKILRKGGIHPGDLLILTKPIGTGTLFAADMRHKAKGRWIQAALDSMTQSNKAGASCLLEHGARACTDVTGFGLLGHLGEMMRASAVDVEIELSAIPFLEGAENTVRAGILSSLHEQNEHSRDIVANHDEIHSDPRYPLVFDPQTAGGLLAAIPPERADSCIEQLRISGYMRAAKIGVAHPIRNQDARIFVRP